MSVAFTCHLIMINNDTIIIICEESFFHYSDYLSNLLPCVASVCLSFSSPIYLSIQPWPGWLDLRPGWLVVSPEAWLVGPEAWLAWPWGDRGKDICTDNVYSVFPRHSMGLRLLSEPLFKNSLPAMSIKNSIQIPSFECFFQYWQKSLPYRSLL